MQITIGGVDRSSLYTPEELAQIEIVMEADKGEPGIGSIPVPSFDGNEEAWAGQSLLIESGGYTIIDGFLGGMSRDQNGVISNNRLVFTYVQADENALLGGHRAEKWVRPAETDRDRILAAITKYLGHLSLDTSMVLATNEEMLPAKTYMTENLFDELQADCGDPTAKGMFIEHRRFHWHRQQEGDDNGISIVPKASADGVTSFYLDSSTPPQRHKDPADLVVDVVARNNKGARYHTFDATAQTRHDSDGARHERLIEDESATLAQLTQRADRLLATYKTERYTFEGVIGPLTSEQAVKFVPGSLITGTNYVWGMTAVKEPLAAVRLKYVHPDQWMVTVNLGFAKRLRVKPLKTTKDSSAGTGASSNGGAGCCTPWACDTAGVRVHTDGGADVMMAVQGAHGTGLQVRSPSGPGDMMYVYNGATYRIDYLVYHSPASNNLFASLGKYGAGGLGSWSSQPVGGGVAPLVFMGDLGRWCKLDPTPDDIPAASSTWTSDFDGYIQALLSAGACVSGDDYASSISAHVTYVSGPDPRFEGLGGCAGGLPDPGQPVDDPLETTTGDGVTTTDTTAHATAGRFGYAPGSFILSVNGLQPWPGVHEVDPAAGTVSYDYPPPLGSDVKRLYDRGTLVGEVIP